MSDGPYIEGGTTPDLFQCVDWASRVALWTSPKEYLRQYRPQPYQEAFHKELWPEVKGVSGGIGAAKTMTTVHDYMHEALVGVWRGQNGLDDGTGCTGRIAITGPSYKQPTQAFGYLRDKWEAAGLLAGEPSEAVDRSWTMRTKTGVEVVTITGTNPMAFATKPYTVVHITEPAQQDSKMFDSAMERVSRWPGEHPGRVYCEGTFEEEADTRAHPWYAEMVQAWEVQPNDWNAKWYQFASWLNKYDFPGGRNGYKIMKLWRHYNRLKRLDLFDARVGGALPVMQGQLWGEHFKASIDGEPHHVDEAAEFNRLLPVDLAFDPATHRYVVLAMQWIDDKNLHIFDMVDHSDASWQKVRDALLHKHWFRNVKPPHSLVVGDVAMKQRHHGQDTTSVDLWRAQRPTGLGLVPVGRRLTTDSRLEVLRLGLSGEFYNIKIHPRCQGLIADFRKERRDKFGAVNPQTNRGNDDAVKALAYILAWKLGTVPNRKKRAPRPLKQHHMMRGT